MATERKGGNQSANRCRKGIGVAFLHIGVCLICATGYGHIGIERGDEVGYWRNHSVVIAKVIEIVGSNGYMETRVRLKVLASLSGAIDAGHATNWTHIRPWDRRS